MLEQPDGQTWHRDCLYYFVAKNGHPTCAALKHIECAGCKFYKSHFEYAANGYPLKDPHASNIPFQEITEAEMQRRTMEDCIFKRKNEVQDCDACAGLDKMYCKKPNPSCAFYKSSKKYAANGYPLGSPQANDRPYTEKSNSSQVLKEDFSW